MNNRISYLRNIAIISIVLHHAMSAFTGWPPNHEIGGHVPIFASLISGIFKTLGLGLFSFISGYVLYYQRAKKELFGRFVVKKAKRILIPCITWASVYGIFFQSYMFDVFPSSINGTHLWYLPMLFIGILVVALDLFTDKGPFYILLAWFCLSLLNMVIPFRTFSECILYIPIIYLGYLFNKWRLEERLNQQQKYLMVILGGVICLFSTVYHIPKLGVILALSSYSVTSYLIMTLFRMPVITRLGNSISNNSFAIYLLHQFVINILLEFVQFDELGYIHSLVLIALSAFLFPWIINVCYSNVVCSLKEKL